MKIKRLLTAYALVMGVNKYREMKQHSQGNKNEKCENYYRSDDVDNDGRGSY